MNVSSCVLNCNMPWLFLDTHTLLQSRVGLLASGVRPRLRAVVGRPSRLLHALDRLGVRPQACEGVCVVAGPGSFSAVRTGVLYANLLARLWHKPLVGVRVEDAQDLPALAHGLVAGTYPAVSYVAPLYDAEPNITRPRPRP